MDLACDLGIIAQGDRCYQAGLSVLDRVGLDRLFVESGNIGTTGIDQNGHIQATPGANIGDSAGWAAVSAMIFLYDSMILGNRHPISIGPTTSLGDFFFPSRTLLLSSAYMEVGLGRTTSKKVTPRVRKRGREDEQEGGAPEAGSAVMATSCHRSVTRRDQRYRIKAFCAKCYPFHSNVHATCSLPSHARRLADWQGLGQYEIAR